MNTVICVIILSIGFVLLQGWVNVGPTFYENEFEVVLNEVKEKTSYALNIAENILNEKVDFNRSNELSNQANEILKKSLKIAEKIENWIEENNRTGKLINEVEDCIEQLLEETTDDTLQLLFKLVDSCWNKENFKEAINDVIWELSELEIVGHNLHDEFIQIFSECAANKEREQVQECAILADEWFRQKANDILHATDSYLNVVYTFDLEYHENVRMCQEIIQNKINWIVENIVDGLRDCVH